jgi:probable rRNA maturation factor
MMHLIKKIPVTKMTIELDLQIASNTTTLPHPSQFREWVSTTLWGRLDTAELTIRIVDEQEMADLNEQYRDKKGTTNVLAFPFDAPAGVASRLLGDVVICAPIIEKESKDNNIPFIAHWAHIVVHGTLHLLGYDHQNKTQAEEMEGLETEIIVKLGFSPPYGENIDHA